MAANSASLQPPATNRRRRVRHKVQTPAYASFTTESKGAMLDLNEILNISEDGVAIQCASPMQAGRRFDLCLDLAESSGQIYTTGQVIWSDASGRSGFRFSDLPPASLHRLREWLFLNAMAAVANAQADVASPRLPASPEQVTLRPNYTDTLAALTAVQREVETLASDLSQALQLVATRAQIMVRASGAAVALASSDPGFMLCRASAGPDAPPVGAKLQVGSGFSGECVRSGKLLRCDDTENDGRVDRDTCRALGLRSMLAAPIRMGEKVIGLIEVFSPRPMAFTEHDTTILQRLAGTILAALSRTARAQDIVVPAPSSPSFTPSPGSVLFAEPAEKSKDDAENLGGIRLPRSHLILLICVAITIFFVLGFLLAPVIQARFQSDESRQEHTVLASSHPPTSSRANLPASVDTATLPQLQQLAEQGDPRAQNALGLRYATGDGVTLDEHEAARWFTRAAELGNVNAQSKLGSLYWVGRGVPQNLNQAYFWTVLARAGGDEGSKALATVLSSHLTRSQALAIQQQAESWLQQHSRTKPNPGH